MLYYKEDVVDRGQRQRCIRDGSMVGDIVYKLSRILCEAKYQSRDIDDPLVEEIQKLLEEVEGTMK